MSAGHAPPGDGGLDDLPVVACKLYHRDGRRLTVHDLPAALEAARREGGFVWLGLHGAGARDLHRLAGTFALPPLAVEDAVSAHQRSKLEHHPGVTFAVLKPVRYVDHDEVVDVSEVAVFVGAHFVVTVRHGDSAVVADVRAELDLDPAEDGTGGHRPPGASSAGPATPASVLHRLLDRVVDGYTAAADAIAVDIDDIEEQVFSGDEDEHAERIYKLKREVLEFKRAAVPLIGPLQRLAGEDAPLRVPAGPTTTAITTAAAAADDARRYYRDVLDHLLRAADAIDGYDRLLTDVLQAHLTQVGVRQNRTSAQQNEDMRRISAWAAIALVPTAVAGVYGMNFDNMPELHTRYGYFVVLAVIVLACLGLYLAFRARKWL